MFSWLLNAAGAKCVRKFSPVFFTLAVCAGCKMSKTGQLTVR